MFIRISRFKISNHFFGMGKRETFEILRLSVRDRLPTMSRVPASVVAPEPFNDPAADVMVRASDNVDFRLHKGILIASSETFRNMFSATEASPSYEIESVSIDEDSQCIELLETSDILVILFRLVYPLASPTLEVVHKVLKAAIKYGMPTAQSLMYRFLSEYAKHTPLRLLAS